MRPPHARPRRFMARHPAAPEILLGLGVGAIFALAAIGTIYLVSLVFQLVNP